LRFEGASNGKWGPSLEGNRYELFIHNFFFIPNDVFHLRVHGTLLLCSIVIHMARAFKLDMIWNKMSSLVDFTKIIQSQYDMIVILKSIFIFIFVK
jgi:hypothetical protein